MNQTTAIDTARLAIQTGLLISLPILATTLLIGLVVSVFQAVTQIQEQTLSFVPKLFAVGLVLVFGGTWMLTMMVNFVKLCFGRAAGLGLE